MAIENSIALLLLLGFAGLLVRAAWCDLQSRRIPNAVCGAVAGLYPLVFLAGLGPAPWWGGAAAALAVFAAGAGLFAFNILGGGDLKLASAAALWAGPVLIAEFLLVMALTGGALALIGRLRPTLLLPVAYVLGPQAGGRLASVPYAIAIAAGGLWIAYRLLAV